MSLSFLYDDDDVENVERLTEKKNEHCKKKTNKWFDDGIGGGDGGGDSGNQRQTIKHSTHSH